MVAVPSASALTSPEPVTDATDESVLAQFAGAPDIACPFRSETAATNLAVSPRALNTTESGETTTPAISCCTATPALPEAAPALAVIVADPCATARTSPETVTDATDGSVLVQLTGAPGIACPFWSRTPAANLTVSPSAVNITESGVTERVVGTSVGSGGSTGVVTSPVSSPQDRVPMRQRTTARQRNSRVLAVIRFPVWLGARGNRFSNRHGGYDARRGRVNRCVIRLRRLPFADELRRAFRLRTSFRRTRPRAGGQRSASCSAFSATVRSFQMRAVALSTRLNRFAALVLRRTLAKWAVVSLGRHLALVPLRSLRLRFRELPLLLAHRCLFSTLR